MGNPWADLALATASSSPASGVPYHTGYAPNPPASTLAPFLFDYPDDLVNVDADTALTVPAFARGLSIIAGLCSSFPLEQWNGGRRQPLGTNLRQVSPYVVRRTVENLVLYGHAAWTRRWPATTDSPDGLFGYYQNNRWERFDRVSSTWVPTPVERVFRVDRWGVLTKASTALRTALDLDQAARRYARTPAPRTLLKGRGDVQLPPDAAQSLVNAYEAAVRRSATSYVDAVDVEQVGFDARQLQLVEARQHAAAQVALAMNIDPLWVGANEPGSSLTYQNRQDLYRGLIDITLRPYLDCVEQELSRDIEGTARFDLDYFLRGNTAERTTIVTQLLAADLVDRDEARALLDLYPAEEVTPQ